MLYPARCATSAEWTPALIRSGNLGQRSGGLLGCPSHRRGDVTRAPDRGLGPVVRRTGAQLFAIF
jgi:hypothetical protein